ncbi:hypothetical protein BH11PSE5_BH11PSE5_32700 [soil metagenome]
MATDSSTAPVVLVGAETIFVPPAFKLMNIRGETRPRTACASCPSGIWFKQKKWHCFCNVMKFQTWDGDSASVQVCDARETSVARYEAEQKELTAS